MKTEYLFVILLVLIGFSSCEDSTSDATLELSQSTFENISSDGATLTVNITSSDSWTAASSSTACNLVPNQGTSNQSLSIVVEANLDEAERNMTVVVTSGGIKKTISISQQGRSTTAGEYHYNLPVIFHVLYKDKNNPLQYVKQDRLAKILDTVNKLYKDKTKSVDMNLTFTLATTDEDGKPLSTPGVKYVLWEESYPIDCDVFMNDETGKYVKYIWEPNNYINVMVYNFKDDESTNSTTLGIAHIPFSTVGSNYLEGLSKTQKSYLEKQNLKFPYSVSINSLFINDQSTSTQYSTADITVTLAHELGHYLGLHHAFSENDEGICFHTDFRRSRTSGHSLLSYLHLGGSCHARPLRFCRLVHRNAEFPFSDVYRYYAEYCEYPGKSLFCIPFRNESRRSSSRNAYSPICRFPDGSAFMATLL